MCKQIKGHVLKWDMNQLPSACNTTVLISIHVMALSFIYFA